MSRVVVKICGITTPDDGVMAAEAGATAVGLNFYPRSRRFITEARGRRIVRALPPLVWAVGVFVDTPPREIRRIAREVGLHAVQLHRLTSAARVPDVGLPVIAALPVATPADARRAWRFRTRWGVLLDAVQPGHGGAGVSFDWTLARPVAARQRILLAGGLTPDNVARAVAIARPWGVDVASGVESAPGRKDPRLVARFIERAHTALAKEHP